MCNSYALAFGLLEPSRFCNCDSKIIRAAPTYKNNMRFSASATVLSIKKGKRENQICSNGVGIYGALAATQVVLSTQTKEWLLWPCAPPLLNNG